MNVAVVTFPGSNCDDDTFYCVKSVCGWEVSSLWHKDEPDLGNYNLVILPGGFSYGDYLRSGCMAAHSPIMKKIKEFADRGGFVLGICNGFQILCEAGLLAGALAKNEQQKFICKDVYLKVPNTETGWTQSFTKDEIVSLPIAHGDGRYVCTQEDFEKLKIQNQILFTYVDEKGKHDKGSNPNGSSFDIAGICNPQKNVLGLMPHPERASDLRSTHGMKLWKSIAAGFSSAGSSSSNKFSSTERNV